MHKINSGVIFCYSADSFVAILLVNKVTDNLKILIDKYTTV